MTWANQLRILVQSFKALGAIVGEVLINAFKPFITALNNVMQKVIQFARTVANALGAIFGWKLEINTGGITNDIDDIVGGTGEIEDNTGETAGNLDDAAKNAKKFNKQLQKFDELNNLTFDEDTDTDGGGKGAGGAGAGGLGDLGAGDMGLVKTEGLLDKYKSDIDSLFELGRYISDTLARALESINWPAIYEKARNFGKGLAEFLNGLITPRLFEDIGKTIAGALNTVFHALDSFGFRFDWINLGDSIAAGINGALKTIDWNVALSAAKNWGEGIGRAVNSFILKTDFSYIGKSAADAINTAIQFGLSIGDTINFGNIGESISDAINSFFKEFDFAALARLINVWAKGILETVVSALNDTDWSLIGKAIGDFLSDIDFFDVGKKIGSSIWKAISAGLEVTAGIFSAAPIETMFLSISSMIGLINIKPIKKLTNALKVLAGGGMLSKTTGFLGKLANALTLVSSGAGNVGEAFLLYFPKATTLVTGLANAFSKFAAGVMSGNIFSGLKSGFSSLITAITTVTRNLSPLTKGIGALAISFGEFAILKDAFHDIAIGSDNIVAAIGKIVATAGIAAAALSALFPFPGGVVIAGISAIVAAIMGIKQAEDEMVQNSALVQFSNEIDEIADHLDQRVSEIESRNYNLTKEFDSAGQAEAELARDLAAEYEELSEKTGLTVAEQTRLKDISSQLAEIVPGLSGYIDQQTGYLTIQTGELEKLIDMMQLYAKQEAAMDSLKEAYKMQVDAQVEMTRAGQEASSALDDLTNKYGITSEKTKKYLEHFNVEGLRRYFNELQSPEHSPEELEAAFGFSNFGKAQEVFNELEKSITHYKDSMSELKRTQSDAGEIIEATNTFIRENTEEISDNKSQLDEYRTSSSEFKQAFIDVSDALSSLDLNFSENFTKNLAELSLEDSGAVERITGYFQKMKDETEVTSAELTTLFSEIAPNISKNFVESLSKEDSAMQAEIAVTLANMASGAKVSGEELSNVFKTLGLSLPESIIGTFSEKSGDLQEATLNFLAKIDEGGRLSADYLSQTFETLGLDVATSLSTTLSEYGGDVQQAVIQLLANIKSGKDVSNEEILGIFTQLGFDLPNSFVSAINQEGTNVYAAVAGLIGQMSAGATELSSGGYQLMLENGKWIVQGLADGINQNASTIDSAMSSLSEHHIMKPITTKLEINSPSKVFEEYGRYIVEGLNLGITGSDSATAISKWVESIKNEFTPEKWTSAFEGIKSAFIGKWEEITEWWNGTAIVGWWEEGVVPWFTVEKWTELLLNVYTAFETQFTEIFNLVNETWINTELVTMETWTRILDFYVQTFETITETTETEMGELSETIDTEITKTAEKWESTWLEKFPGAVESAFGLVRFTVEDTISYILEMISSLSSAISELLTSISSIGPSLSSAFSGMPSGISVIGASPIAIPAFASGGMPRMGDLFLANEQGPELIGTIGGRTSVANNDQIIAGIAQGVRYANEETNSLLRQMIDELKREIIIEIDKREVGRAVQEENDIFRNRTGHSMFD